jgi:hypothetical protein
MTCDLVGFHVDAYGSLAMDELPSISPNSVENNYVDRRMVMRRRKEEEVGRIKKSYQEGND